MMSNQRSLSYRDYQNFVCMGCGFLFSYIYESHRQHYCGDCYRVPEQTWGIKGYPPHRSQEAYHEELRAMNIRTPTHIVREEPAPIPAPSRHRVSKKKPYRKKKFVVNESITKQIYRKEIPCMRDGCPRPAHAQYRLCGNHIQSISMQDLKTLDVRWK